MAIASLIKFELCEDLLETCQFSTRPTECTDKFCSSNSTTYGSCAVDFPVAGACCTKSNPPSCLAAYQANYDADADRDGACGRVRSALLECNSISGFATLAPTAQARCLCYNKASSYVPTSWDNAATSCYLSGSSAHPVLYSLLVESSSLALGLCTKVSAPGTVIATGTGTRTGTVTGTVTAAGSTATATVTTVAGTGSTVSATSGSAAAATQTRSVGLKTHDINRKFLLTSLLLVLPYMLIATAM